jgi:methyltransferase family protein
VTNQQPNLQELFSVFTGYQRAAIVKAGIDLDIFSVIGAGTTDVAGIAKKTSASERGIRSLCDALVALNFLSKESTSYRLTPTSEAFLDKKSPAYVGGWRIFCALRQWLIRIAT